MKFTKNLQDEAGLIKVMKDSGKLSNEQIADAVKHGAGSDQPRALIRQMIDFYDRDTNAFLKQLSLISGEAAEVKSGDAKEPTEDAPGRLGRDGFKKLIADFEIEGCEGKLLKAVRMGHLLTVGSELKPREQIAGSRFRGQPALAPEDKWPKWKRQPMQFLLQIDLSDLPQGGGGGVFPGAGLLSFFCVPEWDYSSPDAGKILYHPSTDQLELRATPDGVEEFSPRRMKIVPNILCLPPWESDRFDALKLKGEASERYSDFVEELSSHQKPEGPAHLLLGYPDQVQGDLEYDANQSAHTRGKSWRLALQLDSDESLGTMWGDEGRIYFMIPEKTKEGDDYSDSCLVMQCG
ncbi:MAG TPA: YwqG family protein [Planctomycetota bacterium]|nr:YwqG family protein [Planctomycetota bacterium]